MKALFTQYFVQKAIELGVVKLSVGIIVEKCDEINLRALRSIQLCLSNKVLKEVLKEITKKSIWDKLEFLYMD